MYVPPFCVHLALPGHLLCLCPSRSPFFNLSWSFHSRCRIRRSRRDVASCGGGMRRPRWRVVVERGGEKGWSWWAWSFRSHCCIVASGVHVVMWGLVVAASWWERMVVVGVVSRRGRVLTRRDGKGWWMVVEKGGVSGSDGRSGDHRQILLTIYLYLSEYYY